MMIEKSIRDSSKQKSKIGPWITRSQNLPIKAMGSSENPAVSNDGPSTHMALGCQLHVKADLPGPLSPRGIGSSHDASAGFCRAHWKEGVEVKGWNQR